MEWIVRVTVETTIEAEDQKEAHFEASSYANGLCYRENGRITRRTTDGDVTVHYVEAWPAE